MEESMMKIHSESFDDWVQNFAINLENIWEEPSAKALETDKNNKQKNNSAVVIGRGPSIKKHGHLELLAKSNYNGSIVCTDGSLINVLKAGITPEKFPKFYLRFYSIYHVLNMYLFSHSLDLHYQILNLLDTHTIDSRWLNQLQ